MAPTTLPAMLLALLCACGAACDGGGTRERIVLITLDTCRADALASMPATAAFVARGATFTHAYAATSTTQPTHASLLTGLPPWQHGVTENGEVLPQALESVAETLAARGYATGAVVASFPLARRFGFAQGFARYVDEFEELYAQTWEGEDVEGGRFLTLGESITDRALALVDELEGDRQFLWVHYFDAHDPYGDAAGESNPMPVAVLLQAGRERRADTAELVEQARALYRRDLGALDRALGRLLARLSRDDGFVTHVIVTADHGESLGEGGSVGHGKRLVPEQVHVPLALVSPRVAPGVRDDTAGSVDVAATLLALAGLPRGAGHGRDLLVSASAPAQAFGMRRGLDADRPEQLLDGRELPVAGARFYVARGSELFAGDAELVCHDDDPARPLAGDEATELRAAFAGFEQLLAGTSVEALGSDEVKNALKALGYD